MTVTKHKTRRLCTPESPAPGGGRSLFLLDAADLAPRGRHKGRDVRVWLERRLGAGGYRLGDMVVVGARRERAHLIAWRLPLKVALRCGEGADGGTAALLGYAADPIQVARCFTRVVIASGDGRLAALARALCHHGVPVTVVTVRDTCAAPIGRAPSHSVELGSPAAPASRPDRGPVKVAKRRVRAETVAS